MSKTALGPLAVFGLLLISPCLAEVHFYLSDEASYPVREIPDPNLEKKKDPPEYYLRIEEKDGRALRSLYYNGAEKERRDTQSVPPPAAIRERVYRDGKLEDEILFGHRKEMLEERHFSAGKDGETIDWRTEYQYSAQRLMSVERFGSDGSKQGSMTYHYDPRGRLEQLDLVGYFGDSSEGTVPGAPLPRLLWTGSPDEPRARIDRFDESGKLASSRWYEADKEVAYSLYQYGISGELANLTYWEGQSGTTTISYFAEEGRLAVEEVRKNDRTIARREIFYDEAGKISSEKKTVPLPTELHNYAYSDAGKLEREEFLIGGTLTKVLIHLDAGASVEETYAKGKVIVRAYFKGGMRTKEEFLSDGKVIRERSYQ